VTGYGSSRLVGAQDGAPRLDRRRRVVNGLTTGLTTAKAEQGRRSPLRTGNFTSLRRCGELGLSRHFSV
jgi:hypothetical protein